jgi:chaperonin GroEL (HSP60 family)
MSVYLKSDVASATSEVLNQLCFLAKTAQDSILKTDKNKVLVKTPLQVCSDKKFKDPLKKSIHKIFIDYCFKAETISPGSFVKTLHAFKEKYEEKSQLNVENITSLCATTKDLQNLIKNISDNSILNSVIFESISLAGFRGKISIEKSLNEKLSIELIDGYNFKHNKVASLKPIKLSKPRIIFIDGYIESVSEINRLLEGAASIKHPLILVSRGMHEDVITTTKINRERSTMFVYPLVINFDLDGINTITDMCVVSGTTPVSADLGNLISTICINDAVQVDEATIINDSIVIKNSKTRSSVNSHIKSLIEKRDSKHEEIGSLINDRIKSLTNSNVIIRLPDDSSYIHNSQIIDYALRSFKSILDYGITAESTLFASDKIADIHSDMLMKHITLIDCFLSS